MKISKSGLLNLSLVFTVLGLGLVAVSMAQRQLYVDLNNASQYMEKIQFISSGSTDSAFLEQINGSNGSVKIQTNNFILSKTGSDENVISGGYYSSILGGVKNKIEGKGKNVSANVIIGGSENLIRGKYNVILGGEGNNIENGEYSVIVGGKNNVLSGNYSAVLGSDNILEGSRSTVVGKSGDVKGNYSTALGKNSKVEANNSFLWTDGSATEALTEDNVFVVMAKSGMIINANQAHNFAKLTIGGPLIVSSKITDENVQCGAGEGGGILKVKDAGSQKCLCSCDGSGRNSMLGKGRCISVCDSTIKPECGTKVERIYADGVATFSGECEVGIPANGTGAYFMDKNEYVHWSCQTDDGSTVECFGTGSGTPGPGPIGYKCITGNDNVSAAELVAGSDTGLTGYTKKKLYSGMNAAAGHKCAYICDESMGIVYDIIDGVGFCKTFDYFCDEENLSCEKPLITGNFKEEIAEYSWDCFSINGTKMNEKSCKKCRNENGYYKDNDGNCVPLTCHHCAHQGFPYCFPIDFSPLCEEGTYLNQ